MYHSLEKMKKNKINSWAGFVFPSRHLGLELVERKAEA